jgi:hypothetical protein
MRAGQGNFKQFCEFDDWSAWRHKRLSSVCSKLSLNCSYPTLDGFCRELPYTAAYVRTAKTNQ